ncbi:hypothetical protein [Aeromonas sp.]|uniref:hypothetical protein n=1 Tax=Aeromonas sp. TaxID=647 RepID=UPI00258E068B|nr:hypothetical protein [Aeromonas sp.]MCX7132417.1 hypothetical protein [Aeromonas sp.]
MTKTTQQKNVDQSSSTTHPPLLPVAYCRLERAAKLLKCEVDDLYHWASIGAIQIFTMAQKSKCAAKLYLVSDVLTKYLEQEIDLMYGAYFNVISAETFEAFPGEETWSDVVADISGFWALRRKHFMQWEETGGLVEEGQDAIELITSCSYKNAASVVWATASLPNVMEHLWIMRDDLEKLHQHIINGTPFEYGHPKPPLPSPPAHKTAQQKDPTPKQARAILGMALNIYGPKRNIPSIKSVYDAVMGKLASDGFEVEVTEKQFGSWLRDGGLEDHRKKTG